MSKNKEFAPLNTLLGFMQRISNINYKHNKRAYDERIKKEGKDTVWRGFEYFELYVQSLSSEEICVGLKLKGGVKAEMLRNIIEDTEATLGISGTAYKDGTICFNGYLPDIK